MGNKKKLMRILLLSAAGVLVVLVLVAVFRPDAPTPEAPTGPVVIETTDKPEPEVVAVAPATPSPAPTEALPQSACTLLVDRTALFTLDSEETAKSVLTAYLTASAVAPEGEIFQSAAFACELIFVPAEEGARLTSREDALTLLGNTPGAVPVRVTTEKRTEAGNEIKKSETEDAALAKGSRIIKQMGAAARSVTATTRRYVAGVLESESDAVQCETNEGRALLVRVGAWSSRGDTPGRDEGVNGRDAGELKLGYPMRGNLVSYFGMRHGNMHNGLDIRANAATAIVAPGEGLVVYCGERGAYGFVVDIDHGAGFVSRLTHIDPASVQVELHQRVFAGDAIGALAASGGSEKPHMHYELIIDSVPYNPLLYID